MGKLETRNVFFNFSSSVDEDIANLCADLNLEYIKLGEQSFLVREYIPIEKDKAITFSLYERDGFEPVVGALVMDDQGNLVAESDKNGSINIDKSILHGLDTLTVTSLSFESKMIPAKKINNKSVFTLVSKAYPIEMVKIECNPKSFTTTRSTGITQIFHPLDVRTALISDPMKSLQMISGVSAHGGNSNVEIRGHNSDETLIVLDGLTLLNTDHFYGIFSNIDGNFIQESTLYKNNMPVEFGGKVGGMVQMRSIENDLGINGLLDVNLLSSTAQLGFKKGSHSFLINGRRSNGNVATKGLLDISDQDNFQNVRNRGSNLGQVIKSNPVFEFNDLNIKYTFDIDERQGVTFQVFNSNDEFSNEVSNHQFLPTGPPEQRDFMEQEFEEENKWKSQAIGINYHVNITNRWLSNLIISQTEYSSIISHEAYLRTIRNKKEENNEIEEEVTNEVLSKNILWNNSFGISDNIALNVGFDLKAHDLKFIISQEDKPKVSNELIANEYSSFVDFAYNPDKLKLSFGLRATYYDRSSGYYFSPRVSAEYSPSMATTLKTSYGYYNQFLSEINHETRLGQNYDVWILGTGDKIPITNVHKWMIGAKQILSDFILDVEFYYHDLDEVAQSLTLRQEFKGTDFGLPKNNEFKFFKGKGRSYGMDFQLIKEWLNFDIILSYSLSKIEYSFPQLNKGEYFPAANDRRHQFKWMNSWKLGSFSINNSLVYTSGRPYVSEENILMDRDRETNPPRGRLNNLPDYFRWDFGIGYRFRLSSSEVNLYASIYNVLDRQNVKYRQHVFKVSSQSQPNKHEVAGVEVGLMPRILNVGVKISFD